jgi:septal ring factor EnvC (AmiA/AmiB activator)
MQSVLPFINLSLAQKDEYFIKIYYLIESKRNMLLEKQKKLELIRKNNEFLDEVRKDYIKYYNYILQEKKEQMAALNLLNKYVKDLRKSGQLSKNNIKDAKQEQRKILQELNMIKQNLDGLIESTS